MGFWKTFKEIGPPVWRHLWATSLLLLSDIYLWLAWAARAWAPPAWMQTVNVPPLWLPAAVLGVALLWAQFVALHALRKQRDALKKVGDIELALNILGMHFDEGTQLLNARVNDGTEFTSWVTLWDRWRGNVEDTLGENFGMHERMLFHNSVLFEQHGLDGYNEIHKSFREQLVRKLELLRITITRYGDHAIQQRRDTE